MELVLLFAISEEMGQKGTKNVMTETLLAEMDDRARALLSLVTHVEISVLQSDPQFEEITS